MNHSEIESIYKKSDEIYKNFFSDYCIRPVLSEDLDYLKEYQIEQVAELISVGRKPNEIFRNTEEKKQLFRTVKIKLFNEMASLIEGLPKNDVSLIYTSIVCIYARNVRMILHIMNYRAHYTPYSTNIDSYTISLLSYLDQIDNYSYRETALADIESRITEMDSGIVLLMQFLIKQCDMEVKVFFDYTFFVEKNNKKIFKLIYLAITLCIVLEMEFDNTVGISRNQTLYFDEEMSLEAKEDIETRTIESKDMDYKFYDQYEEVDARTRDLIEKELKRSHGFTMKEVEVAFDQIQKKHLINTEVEVLPQEELIAEILNNYSSNQSEHAIFNNFKFGGRLVDDFINLEFRKVINTGEEIKRRPFIQIEKNKYLLDDALMKYGMRFYSSCVYSNPQKFLQNKEIGDILANSFCNLVSRKILDNFSEVTIKQNIKLNQVLGVDGEIDILIVKDKRMIIIECKRITFPLNISSMKNQYRSLIGQHSKQLNRQIEVVEKNKEKMLKFMNINYESNYDNYELYGYIVTKEISNAHLDDKNEKILNFNNYIDILHKLFI